MGKTKNKDDYLEGLENEVRQLKSLNRQLTKRLKKVDREFRATLELKSDDESDVIKVSKPKGVPCPDCEDGILGDPFQFGKKIITKCKSCNYRKTDKII